MIEGVPRPSCDSSLYGLKAIPIADLRSQMQDEKGSVSGLGSGAPAAAPATVSAKLGHRVSGVPLGCAALGGTHRAFCHFTLAMCFLAMEC